MFDTRSLVHSLLFHTVGEELIPHYAICGGAALELHGVRSNAGHDIDILVDNYLFDHLLHAGGWHEATNEGSVSSGLKFYAPLAGYVKIEALLADRQDDGAVAAQWCNYLAQAEKLDNNNLVRVVMLADLLDWKLSVGHETKNYAKHMRDAALIADFMRAHPSAIMKRDDDDINW